MTDVFRPVADAETPLHVPATESEIAAAAAGLGMTVPAGCMAGVLANLNLLRQHAAILYAGGAR